MLVFEKTSEVEGNVWKTWTAFGIKSEIPNVVLM